MILTSAHTKYIFVKVSFFDFLIFQLRFYGCCHPGYLLLLPVATNSRIGSRKFSLKYLLKSYYSTTFYHSCSLKKICIFIAKWYRFCIIFFFKYHLKCKFIQTKIYYNISESYFSLLHAYLHLDCLKWKDLLIERRNPVCWLSRNPPSHFIFLRVFVSNPYF